jgi:hypothetical protein
MSPGDLDQLDELLRRHERFASSCPPDCVHNTVKRSALVHEAGGPGFNGTGKIKPLDAGRQDHSLGTPVDGVQLGNQCGTVAVWQVEIQNCDIDTGQQLARFSQRADITNNNKIRLKPKGECKSLTEDSMVLK